MANTIEEVQDFIDKAVRSRKYLPVAAQGFRVALKLFEAELNEDERASIDLLKKNLDHIQQAVFNNHKQLTAGSLATYKSRVVKVITDFERYGVDATKMANWNPKITTRSKRRSDAGETDKKSAGASQAAADQSDHHQALLVDESMHKIELALRADSKATLIVPRDLKNNEFEVIRAILESLVVDKPDAKGAKDAAS